MNKPEFYAPCEAIFQTGHVYRDIQPIKARSNRWAPRVPGNGRFQGIGLIRYFSATCIQISLTAPVAINQTFSSPEATLAFLRDLNPESSHA